MNSLQHVLHACGVRFIMGVAEIVVFVHCLSPASGLINVKCSSVRLVMMLKVYTDDVHSIT